MKTALVTGITGQDGSYLAEHLAEQGYKVFGLVRRTSWRNPDVGRVAYLSDRVDLLNGDLLDKNSLINAIAESRPDEIYDLAAQSFVPASFSQPVLDSPEGSHARTSAGLAAGQTNDAVGLVARAVGSGSRSPRRLRILGL